MKNEEKINSISLSLTTISLIQSSFWGILTSFMLYKSENATIISIIFGYIISLFISKIILCFFEYKTSKSLIEKFKYIYGKFSPIINILYIVGTIFTYIFISYRLSSFLSSEYLTETSELLFYVLILLITFYIANKKTETLSKVSTISCFIAILIFISAAISLTKEINIENYLPLITVSNHNILLTSIVFSIYFSAPTIYINIIKKNNLVDKENFNKYFYISNIITFLICLFSIIITIGVFGIKLSNLFSYPLYSVLKKIKLFSFIDSLENIGVMLWIFFSIISSSIILISLFNSIKETFNLKKRQNKISKLILLITLLIIPMILFKNNTLVETYNYTYIPFYIFLFLIILIILSSILSKIKK